LGAYIQIVILYKSNNPLIFLGYSFYSFFDSSPDSISKAFASVSLHIFPILPVSIKDCKTLAHHAIFHTNKYTEMHWHLKSLPNISFCLKPMHVV